MILYTFNHYYPDSSGFGRRISRELQVLSKIDEVTIICRKKQDEPFLEKFLIGKYPVYIRRFVANSTIVHNPANYKPNGIYEISRNIELIFKLFKTMLQVIKENNQIKQIKLYCVSTPLTVPLLAWFTSKITHAEATLISFHDLEPELAMHIKKIRNDHWILKIEFILERFLSQNFRKILVTNEGQAEKLRIRTGVNKEKICVIQNASTRLESNKITFNTGVLKTDFLLVYMSTISFDYTIDGLIELIKEIPDYKKEIPRLKFIIIGDGDNLIKVKKAIDSVKANDYIFCYGHIPNPKHILQRVDVAIIPWLKDRMTEVTLPTKLFEFMSLGKTVVVPNFGEFSRILRNSENAFLYDSQDQIIDILRYLYLNKKENIKIGQEGKKLIQKKYSESILSKKLISFLTKQ